MTWRGPYSISPPASSSRSSSPSASGKCRVANREGHNDEHNGRRRDGPSSSPPVPIRAAAIQPAVAG